MVELAVDATFVLDEEQIIDRLRQNFAGWNSDLDACEVFGHFELTAPLPKDGTTPAAVPVRLVLHFTQAARHSREEDKSSGS